MTGPDPRLIEVARRVLDQANATAARMDPHVAVDVRDAQQLATAVLEQQEEENRG